MEYASLHVLGCKKKQVTSLIYPNDTLPVLTRELSFDEVKKLTEIRHLLGDSFLYNFKKESFEYCYLNQNYKFFENEVACSVFSPVFDAYSLPSRINLSFGYDNAPIVLGFATEYESVIHIWLYSNCEIISEVCYCCDFDELSKWCDISDFEFGFHNVNRFEEYFKFNEYELVDLFETSKNYGVLCKQLSVMFKLPLTLTFEAITDKNENEFLEHTDLGNVFYLDDFR